jgi:hypothetical protein
MGFLKKALGMDNTVEKIANNAKDVAKTFSNKEQGTRRLQIDMMSDTPLSKNIRPIIAIWSLTLLTVMLIASFFNVEFPKEIKETIFWVAIIVMGFYFPGRTAEKWMKTRKG